MPPKKRKSLVAQELIKAPTWQKRISSFFISSASDSDCSGTQLSSNGARTDSASAESRENRRAVVPAQDSQSVQEKDFLKDGPNRDQQLLISSSTSVDPKELAGPLSTEVVPNVRRFGELDSPSESVSIREHGVELDGEDSLLERKELHTVKGDRGLGSFELLRRSTSFSGERKYGRNLTEQTVGGGTSDAVAMDSLIVLPWHVKVVAPRGHHLVENFISVEEEEHLLHCLDNDLYNPWKISRVNGVYMGKAFGVLSVRRSFSDRSQLPPMPKFVRPYVERMRNQVPMLKAFLPNEMNAIDYRKAEGHWLKAHMDDRQLSGTILVNLSLGGTCIMTYAPERGAGEVYRVKLAPRSLQILTGESRYNFTHGIEKDDFLSPRRVSMTFRQSIPLDKGVDR